MNKIIFLDIDGVLNNETCGYHPVDWGRYGRTEEFYDPLCVAMLNHITKVTSTKIVLSSTWRLGKDLDTIKIMLPSLGIKAEVVGYTENLRNLKGCLRGNEIREWLRDNEDIIGCREWEYKNYVILDDDSDMLLWQKDNFVQTNGYVGLTEDHVNKAISILNKE